MTGDRIESLRGEVVALKAMIRRARTELARKAAALAAAEIARAHIGISVRYVDAKAKGKETHGRDAGAAA